MRHRDFHTPSDLLTEHRAILNIVLYRDSSRLVGSKIGTSKSFSKGNALSPNKIELEYYCCDRRSRRALI